MTSRVKPLPCSPSWSDMSGRTSHSSKVTRIYPSHWMRLHAWTWASILCVVLENALASPNSRVAADVHLWIGAQPLAILACLDTDLVSTTTTFVMFTVIQQKNGLRNETIGHVCSGHLTLAMSTLSSHMSFCLAHRAPASTRPSMWFNFTPPHSFVTFPLPRTSPFKFGHPSTSIQTQPMQLQRPLSILRPMTAEA